MRRWGRRGFLGAVGGAGLAVAGGSVAHGSRDQPHDHTAPGAIGTVGVVDHARNGFHPNELLGTFDHGTVSRTAAGRTVREYRLVAVAKEIEVAPGVRYPAWTYNGRVPGPTIRATEGDLLRITLDNQTEHPHTVHFHGYHPAAVDGVPGALEAAPGSSVTYEFTAAPFGLHLYHCHSMPLRAHISRGLYGALVVDPPGGRPPATEMVMVLNAFDTDFDTANEVYAVNTVAFAYAHEPIPLRAGEPARAYVVNMTEFDPVNSIHLHATMFDLFRTGTSLERHELTDVVTMGQGERHIIEFRYREPGRYMFHAHQTEFTDLGWMGMFEVT
ncbi:multicopper oxidase domain-containing protein [Actinophytocola oryzae]|uniref:Copper-containing nitrite reductase n=1 Tax=Actinophytocola oryzae TaxID=502181 RepID=A0A4R7W0Q1_9PSEU|nr:multicopper oxidase domain-containing protein [Actinophytocola oryzae]TDV56014.1 multicopper oxidase [Actinophytocola oryzae]